METSYVNDVNRAYAETLMEYQTEVSGSGSLIGSGGTAGVGGMSGSVVSVYEYGIQRLIYTDTESGVQARSCEIWRNGGNKSGDKESDNVSEKHDIQ